MVCEKKEKVSRRSYVKYAAAGVIVVAGAGAGAYYATRPRAPEKNVISWEWIDGKCFAYEGVRALGYIDEYKCGIIERIEGWFSGLGISYRIEPKVDKCLMHFEGKCAGRFLLNLK